jgi:hypothetical protein
MTADARFRIPTCRPQPTVAARHTTLHRLPNLRIGLEAEPPIETYHAHLFTSP